MAKRMQIAASNDRSDKNSFRAHLCPKYFDAPRIGHIIK